MTSKTIPIIMRWQLCSADMGEFRQRSQLFEPEDVFIAVDLELTRENIYNFDDFKDWVEKSLLFEIGQGEDPGVFPDTPPLLTPLGASRTKDMIQKHFMEIPTPQVWSEENHDWEDKEQDDWDSDEDDWS